MFVLENFRLVNLISNWSPFGNNLDNQGSIWRFYPFIIETSCLGRVLIRVQTRSDHTKLPACWQCFHPWHRDDREMSFCWLQTWLGQIQAVLNNLVRLSPFRSQTPAAKLGVLALPGKSARKSVSTWCAAAAPVKTILLRTPAKTVSAAWLLSPLSLPGCLKLHNC